jgi:serine protease Do
MNLVKNVCEQLIENGSVTRGYLGVIIQPLTPELAQSFELEKTDGVLIGDVADDGPAAQAGLRRGDVVVQLDGDPVESVTSFRNRVALIRPGTQVKLEVVRGGQRHNISVKLGTLDSANGPATAGTGSIEELGLSVQTLTEKLAEKLGVDTTSGVVVTQVAPDSTAARQGLRPGTVVTEVDHQPVKNAEHFAQLVKSHKNSGSVLMLVRQGEHTRYVVLNYDK